MIDGGGARRVLTSVKAFFFSLFLAASAAAQPFVGPEVASPPITRLTDFTLAPLRDGYLLAWAQPGHLFVGRLDSSLQANTSPLDIPLSTPSSEAASLVIATNGASALLAWNETIFPMKVTYAATIRTDEPALLAGPLGMDYLAPVLTAGVKDGKFELATGNRLLTLTDRLSTESVTIIDSFLTAAAAELGDLGTVTQKTTLKCTGAFGIFPNCSTTYTYTFSSPVFHRDFALQTNPSRDPIVAADGDHFVGLLAEKTQTHVVEMAPTVPSGDWLLPPLVNSQLVALAGNGKDVLLVSANDLLNGQLLELYDAVSPRFVIASGRFGTPKAFATSSSEFVVTYTREVPGGVVLAGRKIQLQRNRQRAAR